MSNDNEETGPESIDVLRRLLADAEAAEGIDPVDPIGDADPTEVKSILPAKVELPLVDEGLPVPAPFMISDEERAQLPFVSCGLLFVVCGTSERSLNTDRIVQIIPMDNDEQSVILYDMRPHTEPIITQVVHHRVADIRKALA